MNKRNYQRELDDIIARNDNEGVRPSLMLHVCCAVCAGSVLEYLYDHFDITIAYYNPNITDSSEYEYRYAELRRYVDERGMSKIRFAEVEYDTRAFYMIADGLELEKEGGRRCALCYLERLRYTAKLAREYGCDYFATTLTVSPLKRAEVINSLGELAGSENGIAYLPSDFKKKDGYKRSIELSKQYNLYRQNYCGCEYSKRDAEDRSTT